MSLRFDPIGQKCLGVEQVGQERLSEWFLRTWSGEFLGIYACRKPRGATVGPLSFHAEGRASDHRFKTPAARDEAVAVLVARADPLSVQRVIDYGRNLHWRVDRGWSAFNGPSPGGAAIHCERNWDGARDATPIPALLAPGGPVSFTALEPVGFLPHLPNGKHPMIVAEVEPDGRTRIVTFGCAIDMPATGAAGENGEVAHAPAYALSTWRLGHLNSPIRSFGDDAAHSRMIGGADDLGAFHVPVKPW